MIIFSTFWVILSFFWFGGVFIDYSFSHHSQLEYFYGGCLCQILGILLKMEADKNV